MKIDDLAKDPEAWNKNAEQEAARATARLQFKHRNMTVAGAQIAQLLWGTIQVVELDRHMRFKLRLEGANRIEAVGHQNPSFNLASIDLSLVCNGGPVTYSISDVPDITSRCATELKNLMLTKLQADQFNIISSADQLDVSFT